MTAGFVRFGESLNTSLECLSCYMRQALVTARLSSADPEIHRQVMLAAGRLLSSFDLAVSPPENSSHLYALIAEITGQRDPFLELKKQSNDFALSMEKETLEKIQESPNPLYAALRFAVGANIIDYGAQNSFDAAQVLTDCLTETFAVDDFIEFRNELNLLADKCHILYLADNCGEIVFDKILTELLVQSGCRVTLAVRRQPVINDATVDDADYVGFDSQVRVISNGAFCPGTPVADCSEEFKDIFSKADIIISKGQGNFETLSEIRAPIYFLLTVKCEVVARHILEKRGLRPGVITGCGEMIMMKN